MDQADDAAVVTIAPDGPLHVGQFIGVGREAALEWVPADTLFGAIVSAWAELGLAVPELLAGFHDGDPPFLLTSAFPRAGTVRFYPRPWLRPWAGDEMKGKRLKGLRWVSAEVFRRIATGESLEGETGDANFIQGETIWLTSAERANLPPAVFGEQEHGQVYKYQAVPRVGVDRLASRGNPFHSGRVGFAARCGLWFGLRWRSSEPDWKTHITQALDYLRDAGLGGLRSTGHGAFTWAQEAESSPPGEGPFAVTLSRYAPRDAAELRATLLDDQRTAYRLVTVGGWCRDDVLHPWRRRSTRLVAEGSILAWGSRAVAGHLVDVTPQGVNSFDPNHRVLRYGYAFPVPVSPAAVDAGKEGP
jgi:CRISPR-associated protein Csm4